MKFTLSWLKDHIETAAPLDRIVATLTKIGLEVAHVDDKALALKDFVIARVVEAKPHPNAGRLRVCLVDTGDGALVQVVCGAPNARTGMKSVFAAPGAYIPGKKITLGKGVIRGIESNGMLCSGAELELSGDHEGILDLPDAAPVGAAYAQWASLDDPLIEIDLSPNRPDATGIDGIARDLAAAGLGKLKSAAVAPVEGTFSCPVAVRLDFVAKRASRSAFALRLVKGVRNGQSPDWMQGGSRPSGCGRSMRSSISPIISPSTGPGRCTSSTRIKSRGHSVRRATPGEDSPRSMARPTGSTRTMWLSPMTPASNRWPGYGRPSLGLRRRDNGRADRIGPLGSRQYRPQRTPARHHSDARYRFERGVDPAFCLPGLELATRLVVDLCAASRLAIALAG